MAKRTRRFPATLGLSIIAFLAIGSAVGTGYLVARNSGDDVATQAGSPTGARPAPTGTPVAPTDAGDLGAANGDQLIYSEFGQSRDRILGFDPASGDSTELLSVPHFEFYGINGSVSPDGAISYLVLPARTQGDPNYAASSQSELWVLEDGDARLLGAGYDLRKAPAWRPDGTAVAVQSIDFSPDASTATASIALVNLDGTARTLTSRSSVTALAVLGFSPDGSAVYFAETLAGGETVIRRVGVDSGAVSEIARGRDYVELSSWAVSEDGQIAAIVNNSTATHEARSVVVIGAAAGSSSRSAPSGVETPAGISTFSPAWNDERLAVAVEPSGGPSGARIADISLPAPSSGFDAPRFWSQDSRLLGGISFNAFPIRGPGTAFVLKADGSRVTITSSSEVTLFGWR